MESNNSESEDLRENLLNHPQVKKLINHLSLADNGFFLLTVSTPEEAQEILDIIKKEVPKNTGQPIDIQKYTTGTDPNIRELKNNPFKSWIYDIQIKKGNDDNQGRLFVIDGSGTTQKERCSLVDHFAFMNAQRDKIAGNRRGPVLVILPTALNIESSVGVYGDLMTCCSGRFHME